MKSENKKILKRILSSLSIAFAVTGCGNEKLHSPVVRNPKQEHEKHTLSRPPGFERATLDYGPLKVREGEWTAEAGIQPWSSWWYPTRETSLFESNPPGHSPLEKYDQYVLKAHARKSRAAEFEKQKLHDLNANSWEGRCNAWSAASLLVSEPKAPVKIEGITFGVGDLKALLVKSFEKVVGLKQYGQRFNGDRVGVYDDLFPDQLHRVLHAEIFEKKRPLIMDKDPGVAVWNTPIWKVHSQLQQDPQLDGVMHVTSWVFGATPFVEHYDDVGTLSVVLEYTYNLYGQMDQNGDFKVNGGEWTGDSLDDHPDFVTVLPENPQHSSENQEIDWTQVQEITASQ